jgi:hypothetical protein
MRSSYWSNIPAVQKMNSRRIFMMCTDTASSFRLALFCRCCNSLVRKTKQIFPIWHSILMQNILYAKQVFFNNKSLSMGPKEAQCGYYGCTNHIKSGCFTIIPKLFSRLYFYNSQYFGIKSKGHSGKLTVKNH